MAVKKDPHTNLDFVLKNLLAGGEYLFTIYIYDLLPEVKFFTLQFFIHTFPLRMTLNAK